MTSQRTKVIDETIFIYHTNNSGSAVNNINSDFYSKYLVLESKKIEILSKYNVLDEYLNTRYDLYFKFWYLGKLKKISDENEIEKSKILLDQIYKLYDGKWLVKDIELVEYFKVRGLL
ncbi:hypothetical protein [Romboutsia sp.]|uniref:hypothetical protein n=1 Tax=Romboutsia sp. TaxID=1965302 RepID=UPI003F66F772